MRWTLYTAWHWHNTTVLKISHFPAPFRPRFLDDVSAVGAGFSPATLTRPIPGIILLGTTSENLRAEPDFTEACTPKLLEVLRLTSASAVSESPADNAAGVDLRPALEVLPRFVVDDTMVEEPADSWSSAESAESWKEMIIFTYNTVTL